MTYYIIQCWETDAIKRTPDYLFEYITRTAAKADYRSLAKKCARVECYECEVFQFKTRVIPEKKKQIFPYIY